MLAEWVPFESFFHSFATLTVSRVSKHFLILQKLFPFLSTKATMASRMSSQRNFCCWHLAWPDASLTQNGRKFDASLTQVWRRSRFVLMQFSTWIFKNIFVPSWSQAVSRKIWFTSNLTRHAKNSSRKFIGGEVLTKKIIFYPFILIIAFIWLFKFIQ